MLVPVTVAAGPDLIVVSCPQILFSAEPSSHGVS